jgi:hypothetical protein
MKSFEKLLRKNSGYGFLNGQNWAVLENIPSSFNFILQKKKKHVLKISAVAMDCMDFISLLVTT